MRVGIISLIHESNTFIHTPTTIDKFRRDALLIGEEVRQRFSGGFHEISGFLEGLDVAGIEAVPVFYASTPPSGTITRDTCRELVDIMFEQLEKSGPFDGMLVAPHGANAGEGDEYRDLDGHWLTRLREYIGPDRPVINTLDPHANLSPRMIAACNATIAYRTNPHLDQKKRGLEAAHLMARTLHGQIHPVQTAAFPSVAIGIERQLTSAAPCLPLYQQADAWLQQEGALSNSVMLGFPYADVEEMGSAFIAVTDGDMDLAQRFVDDLSRYLVEHREEFVGEFIGVEEAVDRALRLPAPVCLLDMGDNVGGGSAADGTLIAHEIKRRSVTGFVCLYDPEAAQQAIAAGPGARLRLSMGGKVDDLHGPPLEADVVVVSLHEGHFTESEIRHGGMTSFYMGPTAVVRLDTGLTISLTSRRTVPVSLGVVTAVGLNPADFRILVAKGVHAPVAAYAPVCSALIRVDTPGATAADMRRFTYRHRRKPMYPFEEIAIS
jgi:microcystin degradation protein MlrC